MVPGNREWVAAWLQDTLYYLPAEAHALGWQPQGLAQRLYTCVSAQQAEQAQQAQQAVKPQQAQQAVRPQQAQQAAIPQQAQQAVKPQQAQQAVKPQQAQQAAIPQQAQQAVSHSTPATSAQLQPSKPPATGKPDTGHDESLANTRAAASNTAGRSQKRFAGSSQAVQLPAPFTARPRVGARIFVQSHFAGIAGALAAEMLSWQQEPRLR